MLYAEQSAVSFSVYMSIRYFGAARNGYNQWTQGCCKVPFPTPGQAQEIDSISATLLAQLPPVSRDEGSLPLPDGQEEPKTSE